MVTSQILRPLSVGEILDRAFRLYRNHFLSLIGITALALTPVLILEVLSQILMGSAVLVNGLQSFFVLCLVQGSLTYAVASAYLGHPFSIGRAYRAALSRYGSLWGAIMLQILAICVPVVLLGCALIEMTGRGAGTIIVTQLLFVALVILFISRWLLAVPSIMQEGAGAVQGLGRSWKLTHGIFWRVLGVLLLTLLIADLPSTAVTYGLTYFFPGNPVGPLVKLVLTELSLIVALPWSTGVTVLLYYDLRVRGEGYDLELQARELSVNPIQPE